MQIQAIIYFFIVTVLGFFWLKVAKKVGIVEFCSFERLNDKVKKNFAHKEGTVTMGGIIILIGLWIFVLLNQNSVYFSIAGIASLLFIFGAFDDISKILGRKGQGLSWVQKLSLHFIVGAIFCLVFYFSVSKSIPYFVLNALFFVFFVNALNVTDGLNGLAVGNYIILLIFLSYGFLFYDNIEMLELSIILIAICLAFFVFNIKGKMFMGDAGAGMLGGIIAMIAIFGKLKMLTLLAGMIFFIDGLSSLIQVFGRRFLGRRILPFPCPIHHYFINKGYDERVIVVVSWILSIIFGAVSILIL